MRKLPVFLTEYGYGLLQSPRLVTEEERAGQRRWFETVHPQIVAAGLESAMAFVLTPYESAKQNEFGLLMSAESGPRTTDSDPQADTRQWTAAGARWGDFTVSPALAGLLKAGTRPFKPMTWDVPSTAPPAVVLDFVAGPSLTMAKSRQGYLLGTAEATGCLIAYNFGPRAITGELTLATEAWELSDATQGRPLLLAPGERRELPVKVHLARAAHFSAHVAKARFVERPLTDGERQMAEMAPPPPPNPGGLASGRPPVTPPQVSDFGSQVSPFEVYLRTANGNLYQTWPRLQARDSWQWYVEPFASFTPAFFGRAHLPAALLANEPAALAFFFRPTTYPTVYEVRHASVVEFVPPAPGPKGGGSK